MPAALRRLAAPGQPTEQRREQRRALSAATAKMVAPKMVYIGGEEMTTYCMQLIMEKWIKPHVDTSAWEFYDCSCKNRDATDDQVLKDAVAAGARVVEVGCGQLGGVGPAMLTSGARQYVGIDPGIEGVLPAASEARSSTSCC